MVTKRITRIICIVVICFVVGIAAEHKLGPVAKSYPGDRLWPSPADWASLNKAIAGHLIQSRVFKDTGHYEPSKVGYCAFPESALVDPVLGQSPWWAAFNCDQCPQKYARETCRLGDLPKYVVDARSVHDVAAGVKFANKFNLRLVVKNTGHDFLGRNIGYGSLSIWTHNLKSPMKFEERWKPTESRGGGGVQAVSAVTYGAGWLWKDVFPAVLGAGKMITGGTDGTVGAGGGWLLGGGHGILSNKFGLGCDNVLEFEVVSPTGEILIANELSNKDLFWALRGGGGGTFGVVTRVTMRTHQQISLNAIKMTVSTQSGRKAEFAKALAYLLSVTPDWVDWGLSGHPIVYGTNFESLLTAPGKSLLELELYVAPVVAWLRIMGMSVSTTGLENYYNQGLVGKGLALNAVIPPQANLGPENPSVMASKLISRESLKNASKIEAALLVFLNKNYIIEPFIVGGGAVANSKIESSLNPAWRKGVLHFSILPNNQASLKTVGQVKQAYESLKEGARILDDLSVDSAAYVNEAMWTEPNWKKVFWGSNYDRLLKIKARYDPNNTMWCHPCVGSDRYVQQRDGKLYHYIPQ